MEQSQEAPPRRGLLKSPDGSSQSDRSLQSSRPDLSTMKMTHHSTRDLSANESVASAHHPTVEWNAINDDVYNMFFLSKFGHGASLYAIFVFVVKMALYTFLTTDAIDVEMPKNVETKVLVTQFLMLPVAVAMQEDLIATYYLIANLKYSPLIKMHNPHASKIKFHIANSLRGVDALYSLLVNFIILLKATEVLSLFLNFAALQFLQTIDNIALSLAVDGYLSDGLEETANKVLTCKLPEKHNRIYRTMDSVLFLSTYAALLVAWAVVNFGKDS